MIEQLLDHLSDSEIDSETIGKLRSLVLDLAVRGKLVPQNPDDEPASVLLERIAAEKVRLVAEKKIRKPMALPLIEADEVPFTVPEGWGWSRFGEVMYTYRGHNPPKSEFIEHPAEGYVRFIQQRDFRTDNFAVYVPESPRLKIVNRGEIVMASYGNIGNTCRHVEGAFNVAIAKIMEIEPMVRGYVDLLIRSPLVREQLMAVSDRLAVSSMKSNHMRSLPVTIPPFAEQHRIVVKVDALMDVLDDLEEPLNKKTLEELRKSALSELVEAEDDDAVKEAHNLIAENANQLFSKPEDVENLRQTIRQLAVDGRIFNHDENSEARVVRVGDVVKILNGYAFKSSWYVSDGVRVLRNKNITTSGINWTEERRISLERAEEFDRFSLYNGDIVLALDRPLISSGLKVAKISEADLPCLLLQRVGCPRPITEDISMDYFLLWLNSPEFVDTINPGRSLGVPHISTKMVEDMEMILPSLDEQHQILARVRILEELCDALGSGLVSQYTIRRDLMDSLIIESLEVL